MRARLSTTFQSLTIRNYRLFLTGQIAKLIGVWMLFTAQDWLVLELSGDSATALGIVTALQFLPVLLFTLYGGTLADRHDKRRLLIVAHAVFSVLALALGLLVVTGGATLGWVYLFAGLMGAVNAIETPVRQAFVSELVERPLLPNALALSAATFNSARIVGPAVAGPLIALVSTGPVFLINTVTYLVPALTLGWMRVRDLHRPERTERNARLRDGLIYVRQRADLMLPLALLFAIALVGFNFQITLALLAKVVFHRSAHDFGLLSTALAVGALAGALAGSGRRERPSVYVVLGAAVGFGLTETLVGFAPNFWATVAALIPAGFFMIYFAQATNHRMQLGVSSEMRGRVMALFILVFVGTMPLGAPVVGWLSQLFGPRPTMWAGGLLTLLAALIALGWQLRDSGDRLRLRLTPLPAFSVLLPSEPRS